MLSDPYHICKSSALRLFADTISYNHNTESICPTAMRTHQKDTLITKFFTMDKPLLKTHSESLPLETPLVLIFLTFLFQAHWKHLFLFLHVCKKPVFCTTVFRFYKPRISAGLSLLRNNAPASSDPFSIKSCTFGNRYFSQSRNLFPDLLFRNLCARYLSI